MRPHLRLRRAAAGGFLAAAALVGTAGPAAADPPRPTDYRSEVTGLTPATDAVDVRVVGGDAFVELTVAPGHEVVVTGYDNEPYLRFTGDGEVLENRRSPAAYVNARRYGDVEVPEGADPQDDPDWHRVAGGNTYAWHDHRIHWMSPHPPSGVPRGGEVQEWDVLLLVDGEPVTVNGVLRYEAAVAWWPWALVAGAAAAAVWMAGRVWPRRRVLAVSGAVAAVVAVGIAAAEQLAIPPGAGRSLVRFGVPVVGVLGAAVALLAGRAGAARRGLADAGGIAAVAAVAGWVVRRLDVLTKPVLPTLLAPNLDRAGTGLALGLAAGTVALILTGLDRGPHSTDPPDAVDDARLATFDGE
ncbi:MAG TPA: hypothetical protein VIL36_22600 [Acidimicrobiales bacterium]